MGIPTKKYILVPVIVGLLGVITSQAAFHISCAANNDLYKVMTANGVQCVRHDSPQDAVTAANKDDGVMLLAEVYPDTATHVPQAVYDAVKDKKLRLYVEFPDHIPGMTTGTAVQSPWDNRCVIISGSFGESLKSMRIVTVNGCWYVPVSVANPCIVNARIAGYSTAVYGLGDTVTAPILFEHPSETLLISTTKLSHFIRGRYGPKEAWKRIWIGVLKWLDSRSSIGSLDWTEDVRPAYGRNESLPQDAATEAVIKGVDWFTKARFLVHPTWTDVWLARQKNGSNPVDVPMDLSLPSGDGSCGILEGHSSQIYWDGSQQYRYWMRADCQAESALSLTMRSKIRSHAQSERIAANLMDYLFSKSNLRQGSRNNPSSHSFGLAAWSTTHPAYYGDDNARVFLGAIGAASNLKNSRWDKHIVELVLANFRTTSKRGFRENAIEEASLQSKGWQHYWNSEFVSYHPHFQAWMWTGYLWLYDKVGDKLLLTRTRDSIRKTMEAYPRWRWTNGIQQERARMILPLAWLIRVDDTPQHRDWLKQMTKELLSHQQPCGGLLEEVGQSGGVYGPPTSNASYGKNEAPLIQQNGDPSADMLYTANFAFFGLNEAAKATGDTFYQTAADKMAEFLIRIQVKSESHADLDGAWFRGFDMDRWEYWGSDADHGWGVWGTLTGWTQSWIVSTLALMQMDTSLWDLTKNSQVGVHYQEIRQQMVPDDIIKGK